MIHPTETANTDRAGSRRGTSLAPRPRTSPKEAIADDEAFEAVALPLVARSATRFVEASEDPTLPNVKRRRLDTESLKRLRSLPVERVSGSNDEEDEPTYRSFTPLTSSSST